MNILLNMLIFTVSWKGEFNDSYSVLLLALILIHGRSYTFPSNLVVIENKEKKSLVLWFSVLEVF